MKVTYGSTPISCNDLEVGDYFAFEPHGPIHVKMEGQSAFRLDQIDTCPIPLGTQVYKANLPNNWMVELWGESLLPQQKET